MTMTVRRARLGDWLAVKALKKSAGRVLPEIWRWEEHMVDDPFVVVERDGAVAGALFASPDDSPVAWARMAVLDDGLDAGEWLDLVLPPVVAALRRCGTRSLAWMDYGGWAGPLLGARGFRRLTDVVTFIKRDRSLPAPSPSRGRESVPAARPVSSSPSLQGKGAGGSGLVSATARAKVFVRPALEVDVPAIAAVDRAAFGPHWRLSKATVRRLVGASCHFAVAETAGEVVGYAEGSLRLPLAHLNRIAVHPTCQGRRIGALLLRDALRTLWQLGAERITLNTQSDNHSSRRLYDAFGFEETGDATTAWEIDLDPPGRT